MSSRSKLAMHFVQRLVPVQLWAPPFLCRRAFELEIRQAGGLDFAGRLQDQRAFDDVAQLAHVAGPVVRQQLLRAPRGKSSGVFLFIETPKLLRKYSASSDTSSPRSRSGGSRNCTTLSRWNKSSRNWSWRMASMMSRLVAAMSRTLTRSSWCRPRG